MNSMIIAGNHEFPAAIRHTAKKTGLWRRMLIAWLASQSRSKRHWQKYGFTATGYRVPYRVWLHLGAYLEAHQQMRRH